MVGGGSWDVAWVLFFNWCSVGLGSVGVLEYVCEIRLPEDRIDRFII